MRRFEWVFCKSKGESELRRRIFVIKGKKKDITFSFIKRWFHAWNLAGQTRISILGIEYHSKTFHPRF